MWLRKVSVRYWQMTAHEQSNGRVATDAQKSGWHLWTVIIPRRSISGKLVSGQVWRRRLGAKWAYKKFVHDAKSPTSANKTLVTKGEARTPMPEYPYWFFPPKRLND